MKTILVLANLKYFANFILNGKEFAYFYIRSPFSETEKRANDKSRHTIFIQEAVSVAFRLPRYLFWEKKAMRRKNANEEWRKYEINVDGSRGREMAA